MEQHIKQNYIIKQTHKKRKNKKIRNIVQIFNQNHTKINQIKHKQNKLHLNKNWIKKSVSNHS